MRPTLRIFLVILLVAFSALFNYGLIDIRLEEIDYLLDKITVDKEAAATFGIVAKYELIRRRMLHGEKDMKNFEMEARVAALTSGDPLKDSARKSMAAAVYRIPVRGLLNGIRFCLGKELINPEEENKILEVLEIGYFWERNRKYAEAIKIYGDVLAMPGVSPEIRSAVMAHKAFCHSMMSEYDVATQIYEHVINTYPETQAGIVSWKLLDFIESMQKERTSLEGKRLSEFDKAKQFYTYMDYRGAIKFFSLYLERNPRGRRKWEARYYKGRCHEELGETETAIGEYNEVIRNDASREWARQANRRMIMLGEFYEQRRQMAREARKQLEEFQDVGFMNTVEKYSALMEETSLREELLGDGSGTSPTAGRVPDDSLMSLINKIGDLDLTGESEKRRRRELDRMRRELIDKGELSRAEMRELERLQTLKSNPRRRPLAIKKVIDEQSSQLRYIYNKRLRKGETLSGRMEMQIRIRADGSVGEARVLRSDLGDSRFENAIAKRVMTWRFKPVPDSLGDLTVNYPFEFTRKE